MAPDRRSVLRSVATTGLAAVCGCAAVERDAPAETPTATPLPVDSSSGSGGRDDSRGPTTAAGGPAAVSLRARDEAAGPVEYDLEVVEAHVTEETPPRLAVRATNASGEEIGVGESRAMRFWAARSGYGHELVLLPLEHGGSIEYVDGPPTIEDGCNRLETRIVQAPAYRFETLDPGDSISSELEVWWRGPGDACFPTGTYRFTSWYDVWDPDREETGRGDRYRFGFTLGVEPP